jgi:hypothetical protein
VVATTTRAFTLGLVQGERSDRNEILKRAARETAELALLLAALVADGLRNDHQALSDVEYPALRILKEAERSHGFAS